MTLVGRVPRCSRASLTSRRRCCCLAFSAETREELFKVSHPGFLGAACRELRAHDATGSGLLPVSSLSLCLSHMGISYGSPEADFLLRFCDITPDGFAMYKPLMMETDPFRDRHQDSVQWSLAAPPGDEGAACACTPCCSSSRGALIRQLFAQWERCLLRDHELFALLETKVGVPPSPELKRLLTTKGPGGSVNFACFMRALMADTEEAQARGLGVSRQLLEAATAEVAAGRPLLGDPQRNPISWSAAAAAATAAAAADEPRGPAFVRLRKGDAADACEGEETEAGRKLGARDSVDSRRARMMRSVASLLAGELGAEPFRRRLVSLGLGISPELDACIRQQQASGSVSFQRLMAAVAQEEQRRQRALQQQEDVKRVEGLRLAAASSSWLLFFPGLRDARLGKRMTSVGR
ncbi:hypothetical protein Esti_000876 [Eimeria stiedai]